MDVSHSENTGSSLEIYMSHSEASFPEAMASLMMVDEMSTISASDMAIIYEGSSARRSDFIAARSKPVRGNTHTPYSRSMRR